MLRKKIDPPRLRRLGRLGKKNDANFWGTDGQGGVREEGEYGKERGRVREVREGGINQLVGPGSTPKRGGGGKGTSRVPSESMYVEKRGRPAGMNCPATHSLTSWGALALIKGPILRACRLARVQAAAGSCRQGVAVRGAWRDAF